MKFLNRVVIFFIFVPCSVICRTPIEYSLHFNTGYDSNVMRFSSNETSRAASEEAIMGGAETFDSFVYRIGLKGEKSIWSNGKKDLLLRGNYFWSDYQNNPNKKYWSGGADIIFKWGSYNSIRYVLRNLNSFYLRHYIDRDISPIKMSPCFFTDRNQRFTLTKRINRRNWANLSAGYLQRYYDKPFTEFDLDVYYLRIKLTKKIKKIGSVSLQVDRGKAVDNYNEGKYRPSNFQRSYETVEWYLPLSIKSDVFIFNESGFSIRAEYRSYDAEDPDDPLHSGRGHIDSKYDLWLKKSINENLSVIFSGRYRKRHTDSAYGWVKDLKSFKQLQFWLNIEWDLIYDRY